MATAKQKTGTGKFGWCLTKDHANCRIEFDWDGRAVHCACECHGKEQ